MFKSVPTFPTYPTNPNSDNTADIRSATDYYAFGWEKPGRSFSRDNYRNGFNGKENDKEDGFQDYGRRSYDRRVGRFFWVDPITAKFPGLTPYQFANNSPIIAIDLDGLEAFYNTSGSKYSSQQVLDYLNYKADPKNTNVFVFDVKDTKPPVICTVNDQEGISKAMQNQTVPFVKVYDLKLKESQLLDRAQWAYGEGGGQLLPEYANTVNNLSKSFKSEVAMYKGSMSTWNDKNKDGKYQASTETVNLYPGYLEGNGTPGSNAFFKARNKGAFSDKMQKAISETINAKLNLTTDPTNGANQWRGGDVAKSLNNSRQEKTYKTTDSKGNEVPQSKSTYQTIFFNNKKK